MRIKRYEGGDLRRVLTGMITDQTVCARIASQWKPPGLFDSDWANIVGQWCIRHFEKYGEPIDARLKDSFQAWALRHSDEKRVEAIERFLILLSDEHDRGKLPTSDYVLDVAGKYFNKVRLQQEIELAQADIDNGEPSKAHSRLANAVKLELGQGAMVKVAEDWDAWREAFSPDKREQLITYPGALNNFIGPALVRDSFVALLSLDKKGKSVWLMDMAYRAIRNRWRVAYFDAGDMGQDAVLMRMGCRIARHPLYPGTNNWPKCLDEERKPHFRQKHYKTGLTSRQAFRAVKKLCRGKDMLRLSCHPNSTLDLNTIMSTLTDWSREGWVADVVIVDYADILASPPNCEDTKDEIDTTWKQFRRMSQEFHCLVLTATQSNALAYRTNGGPLKRQHFSGRKTKLAHVNGMIGINSSSDDQDKGISRLNWTVRREGRSNETQQIVVAGCWDIYCPAMKSK